MQIKSRIIAVVLAAFALLAAGCKSNSGATQEYLYKKQWEKSEAEKAALKADLDRLNNALAELQRTNDENTRALSEREQQWAADLSDREKEINRLKDALEKVFGIATIRGNGVAVPMESDILFDSGKTILKKEGKVALQNLQDKIKEVISAGGFGIEYIRIDGHTDTDPIKHATEYKDNWLLGAARANAVRAYLEELGGWKEYNIYIASYAYTEPVNPADTKEAKAANRRVEVFIVPAPPKMQKP